MTSRVAPSGEDVLTGRIGGLSPWRATLILVGAATALRVAVLFLSRLELYPDEAQYWVWSRHLAFGYFSKPPMIAWLIRLTTALGGDGEAWIRLSAPLLHGGAALALARAARRLYGERAGFWAALFYTLIPGVQLSSAIVATDAPLMLFLSLTVWAYAAFSTVGAPSARHWAAAAMGAVLGLAFLTKYAALYIAGGVLLHAVVSGEAQRRWDWQAILLYLGAGLVVAAPNLIWNATNHFQTVAHTAENADLNGERGIAGLFGPRGPFGFILGQFGVFGPVPFAVLIAGTLLAVRRKGPAPDTMLLCLAAPALTIVFIESIAARANANWAGAAYAPAVILVAALLERWRAWRILAWGVGAQTLIALSFLALIIVPGLADGVGASNAFKRARGWREGADAVVAAARTADAQAPLSAVAVDDRFLFNALSYYGRDAKGRPAGALPAPLKAWIHLAKAANQAEAETPLLPENGRRVLAVSANEPYLASFKADFQRTTPAVPAVVVTRLDGKHDRPLDLFIGQNYVRQPRDPVSGLPTAP